MNLASSSSLRRHQLLSQILSRRFISTGSVSSGPSTAYISATHVPLNSPNPSTQELLDRSSSYLLGVYARPDFVLDHGRGLWVWDTDGRKYLDFSAGIAVNALGHADEGVTEVLATQSQRLVHASNVFHNEWAGKLAELLVTLTQTHGGLGFSPGSTPAKDSAKVFFSNSGAEANEGALKIARKNARDRSLSASSPVTKEGIVHLENSFHGRTIGALSVTGNKKYTEPFGQLLQNVSSMKLNDFTAVRERINEGTAAVILEPIQGEGGVNAAQVEWLISIRERCNEVGATLIFDEIQCGLFRTGTLWAHSQLPVECHPDIVTMAKPLANGFPIGAVMLKDSLATAMTPGSHGTTFGGSPLACAVGHHVLSRLSDSNMVTHVNSISEYLHSRLSHLPKWFPKVLTKDIRGRGLIRGLAFNDSNHPTQVVQLARERGVLVLTAGSDAVRLVPSLTVKKEEIDFAVDVLESSLSLL
ncbi:pyridoxal phosphate-dependent transferase [Flagelloscypha sp. PMI_526]|nr:pyridoxal phosphate-dependent transferase [Flagelloscypha sp. PMI_526]